MEVVDEVKKKRFFWGVLLVWAPWIPILIGLGDALIGISRQKATGIGAVAGGLTELFVVLGRRLNSHRPGSRDHPNISSIFARTFGSAACFLCFPSASVR